MPVLKLLPVFFLQHLDFVLKILDLVVEPVDYAPEILHALTSPFKVTPVALAYNLANPVKPLQNLPYYLRVLARADCAGKVRLIVKNSYRGDQPLVCAVDSFYNPKPDNLSTHKANKLSENRKKI